MNEDCFDINVLPQHQNAPDVSPRDEWFSSGHSVRGFALRMTERTDAPTVRSGSASLSQNPHFGIVQTHVKGKRAFELYTVKLAAAIEGNFIRGDGLRNRPIHNDMASPDRMVVGDVIELCFDLTVAGGIRQRSDKISFLNRAVV